MSHTPDGVPRLRFPKRRENFGDSRTFKADIGSERMYENVDFVGFSSELYQNG